MRDAGRTHQLRVALKSNGSAILGDPLYSSTAAAATSIEQQQPPDRMYLHAAAIRVQLPAVERCHLPGMNPAGNPGSTDWFQAVDWPAEGQLFQHPEVQQAIAELLPADLQHDYGTWFPGHKLMMSTADTAGVCGSIMAT